MNLIHIFKSWYYCADIEHNTVELINGLTKQQYNVNPNVIEEQLVLSEQSTLLRNSNMLVQGIKILQPGGIKLYDPRWLQIVALGQLPQEHKILETPGIIVIPGYIWWQTVQPVNVEWFQAHKPVGNF